MTIGTVHFGLTQLEMRAKTQSHGNFDGPNPLCSSGDAHAVVTFDKSAVSCCACIAKLASTNSYKTVAIAQLAKEIAESGFRVFIAKNGEYGFYTDAEGRRVVSFQYDLGGFTFSGSYKTASPRSTGTNWQLDNDTFGGMFNQHAPSWAVGSTPWKFTTLAQHMETYQWSSNYTEFFVKGA